MTQNDSAAPAAVDPGMARESRRVIGATFLGTTIEWYDFFLYAACAALVFGPQFFPSDDPAASQLGAFVTFAFGFVARPLGGILAGHFGDRIGRKRMLVLSLFVMGGATVLIGLVPNFEAIGIAAPILLVVLRLAQGLGVGAEWGGAVTMAIEYAPPQRRALYGAAPMIGLPAGLMLANLMLIVLLALTGPAFQAWGWRIGFVISVVLVVVGLWTRRRLGESPLFESAVKNAPARVPFMEVFARFTPQLIVTIVIAGVPSILSYLVLTWALSYGTAQLGYGQSALLWIGIACCVLQIVMIPLLARIADRRGLVPMGVLGGILMAATAIVFFLLFNTGEIWLAAVGTILAHASTSFAWAVVPPILTRTFPSRLRYSGVSMAYQFGAIVGGGIAPLIATSLLAATGSTTPVALYVVGASLLMAVCTIAWGRFRPPVDDAA
ncbi:MFS family permease [Microbacterium sp. SORGH_AS428]|uniref:MFS transporter n=1 Tax=Microbacterium sp. SORGH_AS_0428 TaxID=3041788 RepID=UPI002866FAB0|nr:MFS transporter [Microbacterium sp. SORGH_AS_0428]MDR6199674.1 MFS family permease [Microbacterium sp. SORGH_AS_0428]